ncbi:hypothetical protein ACIRYZ_38900 [Kitasatospora sp. NPDC101155]|uniref:hypothetical protein n=1 Tax=Kitasatospora sp. NPDC101155 TaxID=3364097 RepID=UPI0038074DDB
MPHHVWTAATVGSASHALRALDLTLHTHASDAHPQGWYLDSKLNNLSLQLLIELTAPAGSFGQGDDVHHHWALTTLGEARGISEAARGIVKGYRGMAVAAGAKQADLTPLETRIVLALPEPVAPVVTARQLPAAQPRPRRALLGRRA